jgi:hypothetical protein
MSGAFEGGVVLEQRGFGVSLFSFWLTVLCVLEDWVFRLEGTMIES